MDIYDIIIVGASTTGSYFAWRMAQRGFSVLVLEKDSRESISPDYDIFHMGTDEMEQFGLPPVSEGDGIFAFRFKHSSTRSSFGNHPKDSVYEVTGMHKGAYIRLMNDYARRAGAVIVYGASFKSLLFDAEGRINGVVYEKDGAELCAACRLTADCSGIPAVVRTSLPEGYGSESFKLTADDVFFVVLKYIKYNKKPSEGTKPSDELRSDSWIYYKTWLAPAGAQADGILGVGANFGYDYALKMLDLFTQNVKLPEYTVIKTEKGRTPYHRTPYSFVADGFIAMGDAACLTKPFCGEGCTSAMVQADIAVQVASKAMENGLYPTREALWSINKLYNNGQGKDFAGLLAMLTGVVKHSVKANEFMFANDVVFSNKILGGMGGGMTLTAGDYIKTACGFLKGLITGKLRTAEVKSILGGVLAGGKITEHYAAFPQTPQGFDAWVKAADELWEKAGKMSDWRLLD